jgi:hypothetical protein
MENNLYNHKFISNSSGSFICFKDIHNTIKHQLKVISQKNIPGLLSAKVYESENNTNLQYDITSTQVFEDFLKTRVLTRVEFLDILLELTTTILDTKNYLLYERCISFEKEHIYIHPDSLQIKLLYLPVDNKSDINKNFKNFIKNFITETAVLEEEDNSFLLKTMNFLKDNNFTLRAFYNLLQDIKQEDINKYINNKKAEEQPNSKKTDNIYIKTKGIQLYHVLAALLQTILIILGFIIYPHVKSTDGENATTVTGLVIILFVLDYFLYKYIFRELFRKKSGIITFNIKAGKMRRNSKSNLVINTKNQFSPQKTGKTFIQNTVLLKNDNTPFPFFKSMKNDNEIIEINKNDFIIGRLENHVDYISNNPSIGKIHAEIIKIENSFFIKDLNSKNGSFLNNKRLDSNKKYKLTNNDNITLANAEYKFIIPEEK